MTTFDPSGKSSTVTLSNGNLTAVSSTAVSQSARSTVTKSSGSVYWEVTVNTLTNDVANGITNSTEPLNVAGGIGADANGMGFYCVSPTQATYVNGSQLNIGSTASSAGEIIYFAVNFGTSPPTAWISTKVMRSASTPWNNSSTANPSTSTGGQSLTGLNAGPYYAVFNDDVGGAKVTINFGGSAFTGTIPTGFSSWDIASETGTITATTKKPTTSITAKVNEKATITATTKKPTTSLTGKVNETGTISATTKKPATVINGTSGSNETGTISATTKKPATVLNGSVINEIGTISATTKKPASVLSGNVNETGSVTATTKKPRSVLSGSVVNETGTITATTKKPTTTLNGTSSVPGSDSGTITATTKKPLTSIFGVSPIVMVVGGPGDGVKGARWDAYRRPTERQRRKARSRAAKALAKARAAPPASETTIEPVAPGGVGYDMFQATLAAALHADHLRAMQIQAEEDDEDAAIEAILMAI